ncbi:MAG: hypothetical protein JXA71_09895 [Chitinispirillaceae bacterium]|nr:hypothetical protein [Chitinispirillaceae bacterium]
MRTAGMIAIVAAWFCWPMHAQDRVRELFEWGEYDSLLAAIPACFAGNGQLPDSTRICDYYGYLGVAFFAKGNIADARASFKQALLCRPALALDSQYVTPEMLNLFADTRQEIGREQERLRKEDSVRIAVAVEQKKEKERQAHTAALTAGIRRNVTLTSACLALCAVSAGAATYEYRAGQELDAGFRSAAAIGDKRNYDRYQDLLVRQNRNILGFSAVSVVTGCLAAYYGSRSIYLMRARAAITFSGGTYGIQLTLDR